jgi:ribosome recycling factor
MALDDILLEAEEKMTKTEQVVQHEFAGLRTGRASPVLVENITVEVYGSHMRIRELAGITTPEARVLMIQPWDVSTVHPIEKAILKSNLGVTPTVQGKIIRLVLPELSQERRHEMVKIVRKMTEDGRVAIRHVRRDAIEAVKKEKQSRRHRRRPGRRGGKGNSKTDRPIHRQNRRPSGRQGKRDHDGLMAGGVLNPNLNRFPLQPCLRRKKIKIRIKQEKRTELLCLTARRRVEVDHVSPGLA